MRHVSSVVVIASLFVAAHGAAYGAPLQSYTPQTSGGTLITFEGQAEGTLISNQFSGVTFSRKSSLTRIGVAKPQAPRHSTSTIVHFPSGLVAPASPAPVCCNSAFSTSSAPQMLHGDVVHTCTKFFPTGCW